MNRSIRGFNQENIQDMNRTLLLNLLRKEGICARAHLANLSQLKQATVTNIVSDFIDWGLVKEVGFLVGNKGRRSIGISINNDDFGVLAIRLARKNYTVGIFNLSGRLLDKKRVELDVNQPPRVTFEAIIHEAGELIRSSESRIFSKYRFFWNRMPMQVPWPSTGIMMRIIKMELLYILRLGRVLVPVSSIMVSC